MKANDLLSNLGLSPRDPRELPDSEKRFSEGAQYRVEIPSVEGPRVLEAVIEEARKREVQLHRISQGSGIMLLTDAEITEMCQMAREAGLELSLFVGPRAAWETGAGVISSSGKTLGAQHRGQDQLAYALEDVLRGVNLGLRGVLVADLGLLWVLRDLKAREELPGDLVVKVSVQLAAANAAAIKAMERLGADTYNVPTDLSLAQLAAMRAACDLPFDVYVEAPDDFGGFVRHYETPELVRVASPVFVKFGLRNAPNIYPSGTHLEATAVALGKERVRRAEIGLAMLERYYPEAQTTEEGASFPGIPADTTIAKESV
ncbi:MAG: U32 family peptidase [Actinobacteria bacterium]|nr:U32 family peptidase [Actinomycetota bacterium]MCA1738969.1 U32 family peptidase [Actinomycetota bacterium]